MFFFSVPQCFCGFFLYETFMLKTVIIDIENTFWQFSDAFCVELAKINGSFLTPEAWTRWDIREGYSCGECREDRKGITTETLRYRERCNY
jgi:hypothetical protein